VDRQAMKAFFDPVEDERQDRRFLSRDEPDSCGDGDRLHPRRRRSGKGE
jgi:hypothetical protein